MHLADTNAWTAAHAGILFGPATACPLFDDFFVSSDMQDHLVRLVEVNGLLEQEISHLPPNLGGQTDAMLMAGTARHDQAAFIELFRRYAPKIKSFYIGRKAPPAQADDLVQDVMVNVWRRADTYDPGKAAVATWIFTLARNRYIDHVRKEKRAVVFYEIEFDPPSEDMSADERVRRDQETQHIHTALAELSPEQSEVIRLAYLKEMSHSEISNHLRIPLGTVKSRIRMAMERLRTRLESEK